MKTLIISLAVLIVVAIGLYTFFPSATQVSTDKLNKFSSYEELKNYVKSNTESYRGYGGTFGAVTSMAAPAMAQATGAAKAAESAAPALTNGGAGEYSQTNIQVQGVDEPDIVKNDGKYIYAVSGKKVVIVDAYPAESAKILSQIELNGTAQEIFVNKDKLIIFEYEDYYQSGPLTEPIASPIYSGSKAFVKIYDVTDRASPVLKRNITVDGSYFDSRMIGDYAYVIVNEPVYYSETTPIPLPVIQSNGIAKTTAASDIYYFDYPDYSYQFTNILGINTQNDGEDFTSKTFLMGYSQNLYVSQNNIYSVYAKQVSQYDFYDKIIDEVIIPSVPFEQQQKINNIKNTNESKYEKMQEISKVFQDYVGSLNPEEAARVMNDTQQKMEKVQIEISKEMEKTVIHKISVDNGDIEYKASGNVPGHVLNQFSMDENNNYFRIATTVSGYVANKDTSTNNMYVLDENLNIVGRLEDVATGESIYAVRFIGNRAYMVTFRHIDPLFVIDLSNPTNPTVLGQLKIPGYSDYLHPYDETHIIGLGKEVDASIDAEKVHTEGAVYYTAIQGVKISIFDVSDVQNPIEMYKEVIGDRGTESLATSDHKAFLFDKQKELLVIPITVAQLKPGQSKSEQGDFVFQGAYVYKINLQDGLVLKGKITHLENDSDLVKSGYYYYGSPYDIKRSLYMNNVLYTLSGKMIKMNNLDSMSEINKIQLPYEEGGYYYPYMRGV
jgi:uncharacterized secreted protein with C-terminal beta-propeller domain